MKAAIAIIAFVLVMLGIMSFLSSDACLDAGGVYSSFGFACHGAYDGFVPPYNRPALFLWGFTIIISGIFSYAVTKGFTELNKLFNCSKVEVK